MFKNFNEFIMEENYESNDIFEDDNTSQYAALSQAENKLREKIQDLRQKIDDSQDKPDQLSLLQAQYNLLVYQLKVLGAKKTILLIKNKQEHNKSNKK